MLFDVDDTLSKFSFGGKRTIPPELVTQLKDLQDSGIRLGIVSNNPNSKTAKQFQAQLEKQGIHMDVVTHADKPNPEGLKLLQQKFGIPANQMVMVGDQSTDVEAGQNAGFKTIQVDWFGESNRHKKMMHKLDEVMLKADKAKGVVNSQSNLNYFPALNQPEVAAAG
jgi:HAD superfamily hydrolase (TIGR01662 family)